MADKFLRRKKIKKKLKFTIELASHILSMSPVSSRAPGKSRLLPKTSTGIPASCGLSRSECSSFRDASILSKSAASTMYLKKIN